MRESAHRIADLPFDRKAAFKQQGDLNAIWEAERAAVGTPTAVPISAATIVKEMLHGCGSDWDGIRDAALIVLAQHLTVSQICQLQLGEWRLGEKKVYGGVVPTMEIDIHVPVGELQQFDRGICLLGKDEQRVKAWWTIRQNGGALDSDPFLVRAVTKKAPQPLYDKWVCQRFRSLAQHAGLVGATGRSACSPNAVRKAFEHARWEQSGLVRTARQVGMSTQTLLGYAPKVSVQRISVDHDDA